MSDFSRLPNLSFFAVTKYSQPDGTVCDFMNIPRPHYCMGFILQGVGEFDLGSETVIVRKGDIIFVPMDSTYASKWSDPEKACYISAHFLFDYSSFLFKNNDIKIQKITFPTTSELQNKFEKMYEEYNRSKSYKFSALSVFYDLMSMVYPNLIYSYTSKIDSRIEMAIKYIEQHCTDSFSIEHLARVSNMSASHFYACFKNSVGCSPIKYKQKICIRKAEIMLIENNNISIEEISDRLNFNSSIYFREFFKKLTGKTPTQYRKIYGLSNNSNML